MFRSQMRMFIATALAIVSVVAISGCKKKIASLLPESRAVAGWEKSSETRVFEAKDLWQYIDGDAEQYVRAGVVSTCTSDYKYQGQLEAVVDVYTMESPAGARTILDNGKTKDAKSVQLGDDGVQFAQSMTFRKNNYLVRIVTYRSSTEAEQALLALAHGIETNL
jgi:hypothetical protein